MKQPKIHWLFVGDSGVSSWVSSEGRFTVNASGFRHTVTPDNYELSDDFNRLRGIGKVNYILDTVGECKAMAQKIATAEFHQVYGKG
jgi:hypothetical protein